jgi:transcriptional regulator with XRE-family HTH domain
MSKDDERRGFSERLRTALRRAGFRDNSPSLLAQLYNSAGQDQVSVHAVRKWLLAESIPTQDKLRMLAEALNVSPEWLRFGDASDHPPAEDVRPLPASFIKSFSKLNAAHRQVVIQLTEALARMER